MATEGETVVTENRPANGSQEKNWFVRNDQGGRFGPVDFETVKAWASDGRIGPSNEVSEDGSVWRQAASLAGLKMDWVAEVTPGNFYGPIHRTAMQGLVSEGAISRQAPVFFRSDLMAVATGDAAEKPNSVADVVRPPEDESSRLTAESEARRLEAEQRLASLESKWAEERRQHAQQDEASQRLFADLESRLRLAQDAAAASEQAAKSFQQQCDEQGAALRGTVEHLESLLQRAQHREADGEKEICGLRTQLAEQARVMQEAMDREQARGAELEVRLAHIAQDFDSARSRFEAAQSEHRAQAERWSSEREGLKSELHAAQGEVRRLDAEAAERIRRVEALETALARAGQENRLKIEASEELVLELRSRLSSAEAELSVQRQTAQQTRMQCGAQSDEWSKQLSDARREAEELRMELALERGRAKCERDFGAAKEPVLLEAEPVEAKSRAQPQVKREPAIVEAEVLTPDPASFLHCAQKRGPAPKVGSPAGGSAGLSLAELEQQARRELARLGAQGPAFFMKKK